MMVFEKQIYSSLEEEVGNAIRVYFTEDTVLYYINDIIICKKRTAATNVVN